MRPARLPAWKFAYGAEALAFLAWGWAVWKFAPSGSSIESAAIPLPRRARKDPAKALERVVRAIEYVAPRLPFRALCYQRGLAAQRMLRRRGIDAILHYGARQADHDLTAHVWVTVGPTIVIGGEARPGYVEVARFPRGA